MCICVGKPVPWTSWGFRPPKGGVKGCCKSSHMGTGNWTQHLRKNTMCSKDSATPRKVLIY